MASTRSRGNNKLKDFKTVCVASKYMLYYEEEFWATVLHCSESFAAGLKGLTLV